MPVQNTGLVNSVYVEQYVIIGNKVVNLLHIFLVLYIQDPSRWRYIGDFRIVNSISSSQRYVYIAGTKGIMRFDNLKEQWETPITPKPFPDSIILIAVDVGANEVWFVTKTSIGRYNPVFEDYELKDLPYNYAPPCSIGISADYIYLWNSQQYVRFDKLREDWETVSNLPSEIEWFPKTSPRKYPPLAPYYLTDKLLNQYEMTCAVEDMQYIWVGTHGQGVYRYNKTTYIPESYMLGIPGEKGIAVFKDKESIWVGTPQEIVKWLPNKGLSVYNVSNAGIYSSLISGLSSQTYLTSMVGNDDRIWLGSNEGIFQFDKQSGSWNKIYSEQVNSLTLDGNKLWVGTQNGLVKLESGITEKIIDNIWVNDVKIHRNEIWVATSRGILRKVQNEWTAFDDPDKILPHGVNRILFEGNKAYFGTSRQGLVVYEPEKWSRWTYPVHLPGEKILSIAGDSTELYIGTEAGVAIWDRARNIWMRYDSNNSPIKGKVYSIIPDKETVYFSTENGMVEFKK
jgi:hypothetical protein